MSSVPLPAAHLLTAQQPARLLLPEIFISVPMAYWVYTYCFGILYFDLLCPLALFIVVAIGADDVFIWFDAYEQSARESIEISATLETRVVWAWRAAASAMLITSLTNCAVFVATALSPLPCVTSFGLFAAIVIFLDYIYVITWLPAATVLYHRWFERQGCCRASCCWGPCGPKPRVSSQKAEATSIYHAVATSVCVALPIALAAAGYFLHATCASCDDAMVDPAKSRGIGSAIFCIVFVGIAARIYEGQVQNKRGSDASATQTFFEGSFSDFVTRAQVRYTLLIGACVAVVVFGISASTLGPSTKSDQFLPSDHPIQRLVTALGDEFPVQDSDEKLRISLMFGVLGFDRKSERVIMDYGRLKCTNTCAYSDDGHCSDGGTNAEWNTANSLTQTPPGDACPLGTDCTDCNPELTAADVPEVLYNTEFDWTDPATQQFLFQACEAVDTQTFVVPDDKVGCSESLCEKEKSACVIRELGGWLVRDCSGQDPEKCKSASDYHSYLVGEDGSDSTPWDQNSCERIIWRRGDAAPEGCRQVYNSYLHKYGLTSSFDASFATGLPPDKADIILLDFVDGERSGHPRWGKIGFEYRVDGASGEPVKFLERVKYIFIAFSVNMKASQNYPSRQVRALYDEIEGFCTQQLNGPPTVGLPIFMDHRRRFVDMHTREVLVKLAIQGVAFSVFLAFVVLTIATRDLIIATTAIATIVGVVICVVGTMAMAGWELGLIESICVNILTGFCVDCAFLAPCSNPCLSGAREPTLSSVRFAAPPCRVC